MHTMPPALIDRLEIIRLSGYTELEKVEIARRHLECKQLNQHGLKESHLEFTELGLKDLIQKYTREAGVRNLEREIGNICRKVARKVVSSKGKKAKKTIVTPEALPDLAGVPRYRDLEAEKKNEVGSAVGLAWTEVGGQLLNIEVTLMDGKGKLTSTGKLGDVMQESAQAAMSYVRSRSQSLGLPKDFYRHLDVHIHIPEGAIPKDGPSAGITLTTTLVSALTRIAVRGDLAMTGEITLRGRVLGIGGVKEKLLAAHRNGIMEVILPKDNEKDLPDIPDNIKQEMKLDFVEHMDEVLMIALERPLEGITAQPVPPPAAVKTTRKEEKQNVTH